MENEEEQREFCINRKGQNMRCRNILCMVVHAYDPNVWENREFLASLSYIVRPCVKED